MTNLLTVETGLKRILLATDLSARSDRALERGIDLARVHRARLTVLHVVDEELPASVQAQLVRSAGVEIEEVLKRLGSFDGLDLSVRIVPGRDHLTIIEAAEKDASDLIIMGRHRNEDVDRPLRGTTVERVLRQGRVPVLVVTNRTSGPYRTVMAGVEFSMCSRFAARAALAVAPGAEFHFVHAFQVPFEGFLPGNEVRSEIREERDDALKRMIAEEMGAFLEAQCADKIIDGRLHRILRNGEAVSVLRSEAARLRPDLLVIGTHGRVGVAHALLGSVAENLLDRPPCDVLAVKAW